MNGVAKWLPKDGPKPLSMSTIKAINDEDEAQRDADWPEHLRKCGVLDRAVQLLTSPGLKTTPAMSGAEAWVNMDSKSRPTFLMLMGETGTGKSVAAALAMRLARSFYLRPSDGVVSWCWTSNAGKYLEAQGMADLCFSDSGRRALDRASRLKVLVIDDIGAERMDQQGFWQAAFGSLISEREDARLPTVVTSNLKAEAFVERYGARVYSRIKGDSMVVACGAEDLRRVR